jgi:hypothetical protein
MLPVAAVHDTKLRLNLMTVHLTNHDPQYWRNLAQQKRDMAARMQSAEARASFIHAAEYYEQMARRSEAISGEPKEPDSLGG